jgi:hypothetical protein
LSDVKSISAKPKKKKFNIFSFLLLLIFSLCLLIILLVSVSQTSLFRNFLKSYIVNTLNEEFLKKQSSLSVGELDGNLFSEVILKDAVLKVKDDNMFKFDIIRINYDIFGLINKSINAELIEINNPSINFLRVLDNKGDSVYNFVYLFSSEDTAKTEEEFDWSINIKRLRIDNLNFLMLSNKPQNLPVNELNIGKSNNFNTDNLKITNFNFETKAEYNKNIIKLWINYLGFNTNFGFDLKGLSGDFYISPNRTEINKLNIETYKSWLQMEYVFIDKLDLMNVEGLESFKGKDLRLNLIAKNFNFDDLKAFLPAVEFLDNDVYFQLTAKGKFDDILVEKCFLKTKNSNIGFNGRLVNLIAPEKLWLDVKSTEFTIDPNDTKIYTPGLPIPDYSHVGTVYGYVTYRGEPLNFETTFDIQSTCGNAKGFFSLDLNTPNYKYSTNTEFTNGNIGKVLKQKDLESNLNGKIEAYGSGFSLGSINTTLKYELINSKIYEQNINKSSGVINISGYNIEPDISFSSGGLDAAVKGNINIRDFNSPVYSLKGNIRNLDVSQFTKKASDKSNLTFEFDINGKGISLDKLEGEYKINLANSYYGNYDFLATPIDLRISAAGNNNFISLSSNLVDFKAKGNFNIAEISDVIISNIIMIQNEISKKFALDTLLPIANTKVFTNKMDFTYEIITKEPEAISKTFMLSDIYFDTKINGRIVNSSNGFEGNTIVMLKNFYYKDTVIYLENTQAEFTHFNNYNNYGFKTNGDFSSFNSTINLNIGKFRNNSLTLDSVKTNLVLSNEIQNITFSAKQDTTVYAYLNGLIDLSKDSVVLDISRLDIDYNKLNIQNNENLIVTYKPNAEDKYINFNNFILKSDIFKIHSYGKISFNNESDFTTDITNIDIPNLITYLYNPKSVYETNDSRKYKSPVQGKIRRVSLYFKGTPIDPFLSMEMNTGIIRYDNIKVGRVDAFVDYSNQNLNTDILISNAQSKGSLRLSGDIPFSNPLQVPDSAAYADILSKPLDLNLEAKNFQINFFSKVIPNFTELRGFLDGKINASGTVAEPILSGNADITRGRMFFTWNGLYYRFEANLKTDKSDLVVERFSIYNDRDKVRHIDIFGKINFAGLSINDIDLTTSGDMYFLDGSSIQNRFGFYGEMLGGIGNPPIRIKGNLRDLLVSGQLVIKDAKIFFPSISSLAYDIYSDDFTYRIITDESGTKYLDTVITVKQDELASLDPFLRYNYILEQREPTVADYITYDLDILLEKNILVNINMNNLTREELNGEFQGNLKFDNKTPDKRFQLFGRLNIVGDSYYRFYKNFSIKDSYLEFFGDYNDPVLNIKAEYKNIRTLSGNEQEIMYVILDITGTRYYPKLTLSLRNADDQVEEGPEAQTKAISYLLFGGPIPVGSAAIGNLGTNVGSGLASSLLYEALRTIAPFIVNTEVIYSGGNISNTDIKITSAFGDAIVKFGGKILNNINNLEVSIEYPLNKLLNINVSNNLMIQLSRTYSNSLYNSDQGFETRAGLTYKIRY